VLGLALLYRGRIGEEEAALERHLGDEWKRYRERTAAFIPKVG
jgi:protein-S-isoprenylcysteine O-methyltransferase Ste14